MNLLLDIGNSRIKWGYSVYDESASPDEIQETGAVNHHQKDWLSVLPDIRPQAIWAASVADEEKLRQVQTWAAEQWQLEVNPVRSTSQACGVRNAYPRFERLGVDRWVACIAGFNRGAGSVLIADAGTAVTLDWVDASGQHQGGLIAPGVATMRQSLLGGTRMRPSAVEFAESEITWLADDTDPAVSLGTLHAARALLENARRELKPQRCLLTGGEANLLAPHLSEQWQLAPHLVLEGISCVAQSG